MNKQQLAATIWESANQMRSKIEANEYKDFILGFIFYKYLSDKEVRFFKSEGVSEEDIEKLSEANRERVAYAQRKLGYFIAYENLFSTWLDADSDDGKSKKKKSFDISDVRNALNAFDRLIGKSHKKLFKDIFKTLQTGLSKLGESASAQTKAVRKLLRLIEKIPMDGKQDYDVLGFIYEYLIGMFAANAGKKAGEFYTPHEVSLLMSEIVAAHLVGRQEICIYDPTSGSGSLLINIGSSVGKFMDSDKIMYYAQELKENTYNLTRMNLVMRGIEPRNINVRNADTLEEDWPFFDDDDPDKYTLVRVDAVVSNPPYSQKWDNRDKKSDPRFGGYGVAPKGKADFAFLLHDLYHLEEDGIMTIVLPHGVLTRGNEEGEIRKNLIEKNNIDAIIGLPANIFFGTSIATIIMVLKRRREDTDVLIIDASKGFEKADKNNRLRASDIKRIVDTVKARAEIPRFSRRVSKEEIKKNDYNLNIPRYVSSAEPAESWDVHSVMFGGVPKNELDALQMYWDALPCLREALFRDISAEYSEPQGEDIAAIANAHESVIRYKANYEEKFADFRDMLYTDLIERGRRIELPREEDKICTDIFGRLAEVKAIDRYRVYQILNDAWQVIGSDLEMIQTEGFSAVMLVDPNMVLKQNSEGEKVEVQRGWRGHIIPFELVQRELLPEDLDAISAKEMELADVTAVFDEILESMSEEEKSGSILNDTNTAFVPKEVKTQVDEILEEIETEETRALAEYLTLSKKADKLAYTEKNPQVNWDAIPKSNSGLYAKRDVEKRIHALKMEFDFPDYSFEYKILRVQEAIDAESALKSEIRAMKVALHLKTKDTIENLSDDEAKMLLEKKWILSLVGDILAMPGIIVGELIDKLNAIIAKYKVTFAEVEERRIASEKTIAGETAKLTGSDFDLAGLREFQRLLGE